MSEYEEGELESETPVNPYSLLEAVNRSSDMAHTGWLIFLGVMAYLMIAVAGVTHKDLLLEKAVQLPIFGIEIPQIQFFQFAPILLVLFHVGIVSQLVLLARKTLEFDLAVQQLELTAKRTHPLRLELHNFFFVQGIAGSHRSRIMAAFLHGMSWLTLVVIPVLLLLFIQIKFLPYHDISVTWAHRAALVTDIAMMILIGVFLIRPEVSFWRALWRTLANYPLGFAVTSGVFVLVTAFSFFVATVPGEALDRMMQRMRAGATPAGAGLAAADSQYMIGFVIPFLTARSDGSLFGVFHRNLIVRDVDLVSNDAVTSGEASLNLRNRDLRYAKLDRSDLHQADLTGANLDGASLIGTDLRNIKLHCADVTLLILTDDRVAARCASARNANFSRALMTGSNMAGIDLRGAKLEETQLTAASLAYSLISGANFSSARLDKADLTGGIQGQGANFLISSLEGADLTGAQLQFADFSSANLQGALFAHAYLQGTVLRDAGLEGADMQRVRLHGADLTGADLTAADLRWAQIWMTTMPMSERLANTDLSDLAIAPLTDNDLATLRTMLNQIENPRLKALVQESLRPLMETIQSERWRGSSDHIGWQRLTANHSIPVDDEAYRNGLTTSLGALACRRRWLDGSVATGVSKRARGQNFRGDLAALVTRLQSSECLPARAVSEDLLRELSVLTERNQR